MSSSSTTHGLLPSLSIWFSSLSPVSMLLPLLLVLALYVIARAIIGHIIQVYRFRHIPGVSQFLPIMPFRIPMLASHMYMNNTGYILNLSRTRFANCPIFAVTTYHSTFVFVNSYDALKHVSTKNSSNFMKPQQLYKTLEIYGPNIISLGGGSMHRRHRQIAEPAFSERHLKFMVEVANHCTDLLVKRLSHNGKIEVHSDLTDVTMDIIGKTNFGVDLGVFSSEQPKFQDKIPPESPFHFEKVDKLSHKTFYDALHVTNSLGLVIQHFIPQSLHWIPIFNPVTSAMADTKLYLNELIERRRTPNGEEYLDLLSMLVQSNEKESQKLTSLEIVSDAFMFLLAGHETTAASLGYLFVELAKHPHIQQKCIQEIDTVLHGRSLTYEDIRNLPYCNNCIKESLRLHPVAAAVAKEVKRDDLLCGYELPSGTFVSIQFNLFHSNELYWKESDTFNPDRFLVKYDPLTFLPFGYGVRRCVGANFALIESLAIMVRLLQQVSFEFAPDVDVRNYQPKEQHIVTVRITKQDLIVVPRLSKK